ncbi:sulfurtransferase [Scopulibacillus cellulosilyticus]|uniref:Sulfurtransferase n=1 Tax=Scopulibacillus cellulosilyticus TaxID=2665665 RepID=A0ABW2PQZ1_9BACL
MKTIISMDWVREHLNDDNVVIVDCRFYLQDPNKGYHEYKASHIKGAVYFDLERDLSGPVSKHGGRHPLPDIKQLAFKLGDVGIDHNKTVVAYDNENGSIAAARFWWLLKYMGHDNAFVMDESYSAWVEKGYPTEDKKSFNTSTQFIPRVNEEMLVRQSEVQDQMKNPDGRALIDARAEDRYLGKSEPLDKKAGHIPSAENWFWKDNIAADGKWKSNEELKERFAPLKDKKSITVYCGSGVTACVNILALNAAGITNVKLYPGSWSDWVSYSENPIESK